MWKSALKIDVEPIRNAKSIVDHTSKSAVKRHLHSQTYNGHEADYICCKPSDEPFPPVSLL